MVSAEVANADKRESNKQSCAGAECIHGAGRQVNKETEAKDEEIFSKGICAAVCEAAKRQ